MMRKSTLVLIILISTLMFYVGCDDNDGGGGGEGPPPGGGVPPPEACNNCPCDYFNVPQTSDCWSLGITPNPTFTTQADDAATSCEIGLNNPDAMVFASLITQVSQGEETGGTCQISITNPFVMVPKECQDAQVAQTNVSADQIQDCRTCLEEYATALNDSVMLTNAPPYMCATPPPEGGGVPPPGIVPGQVVFYNGCDHDLIVRPNTGLANFTLDMNGGTKSFTLAQVGSNQFFFAAVKTSQQECNNLNNCIDWGNTLQNPKCHDVAQWTGNNLVFATYCNAVLANAQACNQGTCCGPNLITDAAWGSLFEIDIKTSDNSQDSPDISTNSNCTCSTSPGPAECLLGNPIFFNIPFKWTTNQSCHAGWSTAPVSGAECMTADCADAYTWPEDSKQVTCPVTPLPTPNPNRGYLIQYCPDGHQLPTIKATE